MFIVYAVYMHIIHKRSLLYTHYTSMYNNQAAFSYSRHNYDPFAHPLALSL